MVSIFEISDDVLIFTFRFLTPLDLLSISETCSYFHEIGADHSALNKYWKHQCQQQWKKVQHKCSKSANYCCQITTKNYNFFQLFKIMVNFIRQTLLGAHTNEIKHIYIENLPNDIKPDASTPSNIVNKKIPTEIDTLTKQIYNMDLTIDRIDNESQIHLLRYIIELDNIELFAIWLCCMSGGNIDRDIHCNEKFDINSKIKHFPGNSLRYRPWDSDTNSILAQVICANALKIGTFILGKIKTNACENDDTNISDTKKNSYNFENIDLNIDLKKTQDTLLTYAAYYRYSKMISLLINHPNMTKKLINETDAHKLSPLHCAVTFKRGNQVESNVIKIVTMLLDDERININAIDKSGNTALMTAIKTYPKCASILIENDKCNVNIVTYTQIGSRKTTALFIYARQAKNTQGYLQLGEKLLQRKDLDWNITTEEGKTALDIAIDRQENNMDQIIKILSVGCSSIIKPIDS